MGHLAPMALVVLALVVLALVVLTHTKLFPILPGIFNTFNSNVALDNTLSRLWYNIKF